MNSRQADPRELDGWRETLMERVNEAAKRSHRLHRGRDVRLAVIADARFAEMIDAAAEIRGLTRSAYVRRAVGAFLASDLDVEFAQVMGYCSAPQPRDMPNVSAQRKDDDGQGYGGWYVPGQQNLDIRSP